MTSDKQAGKLETEVLRPGDQYKRYRTEAELPEKVRIFYQAAAELTGFSIATLVKAVFHVEVKLKRIVDQAVIEGTDVEGPGDIDVDQPGEDEADDDRDTDMASIRSVRSPSTENT